MSCGLSGDLEDPRGAESGVSWTRFDIHPTLTIAICQMQDIFCIKNTLNISYQPHSKVKSASANGNEVVSLAQLVLSPYDAAGEEALA